MLQAILNENNVVVSINDWDLGVGTPCDEFTQIGMLWNGTAFVKNPDDTIKELSNLIQEYLDDTAKTRDYDSIVSCCSYHASKVPKFSSEGSAAMNWRDSVWEYYNQLIDDYHANLRTLPTPEELIAELPTIAW